MNDAETKLIANALFEIRLLLGAYIGSGIDAPVDVRFAAHLAYALHNEASALVAGEGFDVSHALKKVAAIDSILNTDEGRRLSDVWGLETKARAWSWANARLGVEVGSDSDLSS